MSAMTHESAFAALPELALDVLEGAERDEVLAHVRDCIACRRELEMLRDAAAGLGELAPAAELHASRSAPMRGRLLDRAVFDTMERNPAALQGRDDIKVMTARPVSPRWWLAAAGILLAIGVGGAAYGVRERVTAGDRIARADARARQLETANRELDRAVAERGALLASLTGPNVAVVTLAAGGTRTPVARMFWDRATNRWTMFAHNLPQPAAGRTYQLWLITATNERISAGTFSPSPSGEALVQATYALSADALKMIAVTEEPAAGVPQPTGPIVISGAAE